MERTPSWLPAAAGLVSFGAASLVLGLIGTRAASGPDRNSGWARAWSTLSPLFALAIGGTTVAIVARSRKPLAPTTFEVSRAMTIGASPDDLYQMWRDPTVLSRVLGDLAEVSAIDARRQRWVLKGPKDLTWSWTSSLSRHVPGRFMAWRSELPSELPSEGAIHFLPQDDGLSTEVHLRMSFAPPVAVADKLATVVSATALYEVLRRFKCIVEAGEIPVGTMPELPEVVVTHVPTQEA